MLGLPSTTEMQRHLPKKAFYERFSMSTQLKDEFVQKVERFDIVHSIKPSTTNIPAGESVLEVLVVCVELRQREVPEAVVKFVADHNPHKLLFVCTYGEEACLAVLLKKLVVGPWAPLEGMRLDLRSDSMDAFWDSLASQVAYGDAGDAQGDVSVEERFARDQRIAALRQEIARLDARCRKEKQIGKKNAMFAQLKELRAKLSDLENGIGE